MQGLVTFGGLQDFVSAQMTLTQGVDPSVCTIDVAPFSRALPPVGLMTWRYGGVVLRFPYSRLDKIEPIGDGQGRVLWRLTIMDRRWIWRTTGSISGRYNTRDQRRNEEKNPAGVRTLVNLIKDCLAALGEVNYDLRGLDKQAAKDTPEVDWDYARPADALADLCDRTGHVVTLGLDNRVHIMRKGLGNPLPKGPLVVESQLSLDPPEAPAAVVVVGSANRYQVDLQLEAIGKEIDGTVKRINDLSYTPVVNNKRTWALTDYEFLPDVDAKWREIATESVWRWYRVKDFRKPPYGAGPYKLPGGKDAPVLKSLDDILPLLPVQCETYENTEGELEFRPPWVWGKFSPLEDDFREEDEAEKKLRNKPKGLYTGSFNLEHATGIVRFANPVLRLEVLKNQRMIAKPADIKLRVAVEYNQGGHKGPLRTEYYKKRKVARGRQQRAPRQWTEYVVADKILRRIWIDGETGQVRDTFKENAQRALYPWLTVVQRYREVDFAASTSYAGLLPIACDGAITQVTWTIGEDGATRTRASRNREESIIAPTYAERRMYQRVEEALRRRV